MTTEETYMTLAARAVMAEREMNYRVAHDLWADAVLLAKNPDNKRWAEARQERCGVCRALSLSLKQNGAPT